MRSKFKKALAVLASAAMCGSMLLNFPDGTFGIDLTAHAVEGEVAINETNFPDEVFRTYVDDNFDTTDDNALDAAEIAMVTSIVVYDMGISNLKGVEYFTALATLDCGSNQLTSLDVSKNMALTDLDCHFNQLTSLDVTNNTALTYLNCSGNQLTSLDVTNNTALTNLNCVSNQLTSLDVSKNMALTDLKCHSNTYEITLTGNTFALSTLPEGFDVRKASEWTNATIEGNTLTVTDLTDPTQEVTYIYDLGKGSTATFTLKIASAELTKDMVQKIEAQTYTGEAITPVTLICGDYTLVEGTDYTIEYADNTNAGTASYTITGAGIFTGELTGEFEIVKATPKYDIPTNLVASDGVTLADVELPEGFAWADETKVIGKQGTYTFLATFTPKDTVNYEIVKNIEITVESGIAINEENFPDPTFRTYVDDNFDTTDDDALDAAEIAMVTSIDVHGMGISNLKGVEYFTALTDLVCHFNKLTSLNVTNNTALEVLLCYSNQLTSLDVSKNRALTYLDCDSNQLTDLDVTNNTALKNLYCESNQLTSLDVSKNMALTALNCGSNQLTSLDVTNNTALEILLCHSNQLTNLDVRKNTALTDLYCDSNTYKINLTGNTFDLSTLPKGFDVKKASKWTNATIEGNTLTVTDPTQGVTYTYNLSNGSTATFTLKTASAKLTEDMVPEIEAQTYTGEEITPVTLICGEYTLFEGVDYTIEYADNTNAGTASYTITGAGIFTGELTGKFEIVKATPYYEIPTRLKATYGDILADVELPEGWAWVNNTQSVGTVGTNSFDAVFTPADTANYNTVT